MRCSTPATNPRSAGDKLEKPGLMLFIKIINDNLQHKCTLIMNVQEAGYYLPKPLHNFMGRALALVIPSVPIQQCAYIEKTKTSYILL